MASHAHELVDRSIVLSSLLRARWLVFLVLSIMLLVGDAGRITSDNDWEYFTWGSDVLFGERRPLLREDLLVDPVQTGGLHLYAAYPFLQIGPPPLLLARLLQFGPNDGIYIAGIAVQALGLLFVVLVDRAFPARTRQEQLAALLAGCLVMVTWSLITHFRHLDDALTLVCCGAAVLALQRGRPLSSGVLVGVAIASKPWGFPALGLLLVLPTWRQRLSAAAVAAITALMFWGPFLIADAETLRLGRHVPFLFDDGPLAALGVTAVGPGGPIRLLQFLGGLCLVVWTVRRGRPTLGLMAAFAMRLAIDPAANFYYPAALMAGAYVADRGAAAPLPRWTAVITAGWVLAQTTAGAVAGVARLATYTGVVVAVLVVCSRREVSAGAPS